jgi:Ring finger domain
MDPTNNNELFQLLLTDIMNNMINNDLSYNFMNIENENNYDYIYNNFFNNFNINNENFQPTFPILPFYNIPEPNSQNVLHQSLYDRNPIKHVITEEVKNSLSPIKFKDAKDKETNEKCSISRETFDEEDDIIQLPCNHCFFIEYIMQWLTEESCECPVCRYKFDSMEKNTRHIESDEPIEIEGIEEIEDLPDLIEIDNPQIIDLSEANRILLNHNNTNDIISNIINNLFTDDAQDADDSDDFNFQID